MTMRAWDFTTTQSIVFTDETLGSSTVVPNVRLITVHHEMVRLWLRVPVPVLRRGSFKKVKGVITGLTNGLQSEVTFGFL